VKDFGENGKKKARAKADGRGIGESPVTGLAIPSMGKEYSAQLSAIGSKFTYDAFKTTQFQQATAVVA
jgi:hypothetical protein